MRRQGAICGALLVLLVAAAPASAQRGGDDEPLAGFAAAAGLRDIAGFVESVEAVRTRGGLPARYVTKDAARAHGWHGGGLCAAWPEHLIGGDAFNNFSGALPTKGGRVYREADLDATCRERGGKRLIFSNDGLVYLTTDHYRTFVPVP